MTGTVATILFAQIAITPKVVTGYFTEWGIYERNYTVANIPDRYLTFINYAFAQIVNGLATVYDVWAAIQKPFSGDDLSLPFRGSFNQLIQMKRRNPRVKTIISVGGWTLSAPFSDAALTPQSRATFASSCVAFIRQYQFDGVDLDWEYPVSGGLQNGRPEDKHNFTLMLQELRAQLTAAGVADHKRYFLTAALPAGSWNIANIEPSQIAQHLDYLNLMCYDFHGSWDTLTDHHAPLDGATASDSLNARDAVQAYLGFGVPASKIVLGVPFYGHGYKGVPNVNHGLRQSFSGLPNGTYEQGVFDYWDIANRIATLPTSYVRYWDAVAGAPYVYAPKVQSGTWISYDDPQSITAKANFVKANGLGGMMFWELSGDTAGANSLLATLYSALRNAASAIAY